MSAGPATPVMSICGDIRLPSPDQILLGKQHARIEISTLHGELYAGVGVLHGSQQSRMNVHIVEENLELLLNGKHLICRRELCQIHNCDGTIVH